MFGSKGVSHLRSVHTDYELVHLIFKKLKFLAEKEIRANNFLKTERYHHALMEMEEGYKFLDGMSLLLKIKTLRLSEQCNSLIEKMKKKINDMKKQKSDQEQQFRRYIDNVKKSKITQVNVNQLRIQHEQNQRKFDEHIRYSEAMIRTIQNFKKRIRDSNIRDMKDIRVMTRV